MEQFNLAVCGGTFDHFHKGHESFLKYVFSVGKKVIVGVTSDKYIESAKRKVQSSKSIESFKKRKQAVLGFVEKEKVLNKVEIVEIDDLFGPTLNKNLAIDAIVVSADTKKGAEIINQKRKDLGLGPLKVFIASPVKAEDGKLISSARIRAGAINRSGKLYINPLWLKKDLILQESLRGEFRKPFGELLSDIGSSPKDEDNLVITVGDVTTKIFNEKSLGQNISVIDFKVNRKKKFADIKELGFIGDENIFQADNPAGCISSNLFRKLSKIFQLKTKDKIVLQINGEEDLVVLPLVLFSPLNTVIYYGQPPPYYVHEAERSFEGQAGIVKVAASEKIKNKAYSLVLRLKLHSYY